MSLKLTTVLRSSQVLDYSRYDIVDRYWREGSSVKILMKDIEDAAHCSMICPRDWEIHYPQLDKLYGDAEHTIRAVTEAIVAWCIALLGLLRDEGNWKWKNEIIRNVNRRNKKIRLVIKVSRSALR